VPPDYLAVALSAHSRTYLLSGLTPRTVRPIGTAATDWSTQGVLAHDSQDRGGAQRHEDGSHTLRVVVIDDDPDVRGLLRHALPEFEITVIAEGHNGASGIEAVARAQPDAVVLDLEMPGGNGLEALPAILAACPDARVVIYAGSTDAPARAEAYLFGAAMVVNKMDGVTALASALKESGP
jgi:CheY-like chemotaxis protein